MASSAPDMAEDRMVEPDITRNSLSDQIYARLRMALMSGQYEPGARVNIRGLAASYQMSPTPVREAIFQLVREGALELRPGHQPRVPVLTVGKYVNIRETRVPLERLAAELAAVRITDTEIEDLKRFHDRFIAAEHEGAWKDALAANQAFHFTIYRASDNEVLVRVLENLWLLCGPFINYQYPIQHRPDRAINPHLLIIDALERRAPAEAGEHVVRDMREGSYLILENMRIAADSPAFTRRRPSRT